MKTPEITALAVSVDYGDYLNISLPHNRRFFSDFVVVTSPGDTYTQEVCERNHTRCLTSEAFWENGAPFNKAAGLNVGLREIDTDYICALDADSLLPSSFNDALRHVGDTALYGMNREVFQTQGDFQNKQGENRFMPPDYITGFFQLFNRRSSFYPGSFCEDFPTAGHYDIEFMAHWPANWRHRLSSDPVAHLGNRGRNWAGRTSEGPDGTPYQETTPLTPSTHYETLRTFRLAYMGLSQILLLQNIARSEANHVRLTLNDSEFMPSFRIGTMLAGSFIELPLTEQASCNIANSSITAIGTDGKEINESPIINRR